MSIALVDSTIQRLETSLGSSPSPTVLNGEILVHTPTQSEWGGAVVAQMYLPLERSQVWQGVTNYPRWVDYFPDVICSEILTSEEGSFTKSKRIRQVAEKSFLLFAAKVEIYLKVLEIVSPADHHIHFTLEKGDFTHFSAHLKLHDYQAGTLLTYTVRATPMLPVPAFLIQQVSRLDFPTNLRQMRQVLCASLRS
ncbi:MAG: cyclase [Leptolyngbyaceae cyanobacterium SL_7_1]|nr:cyclase [Leptolyngbyaceae cyanobacterium SL_7_1]